MGKPLGELLRNFRKQAGFSQEELASRAGLSSNAISALERGERKHPYPHTVRSLAEALELSEEDHARLRASATSRSDSPTSPSGTPELTESSDAQTATSWASSLPRPVTPLIGRDVEIEQISFTMLREDIRVLTLTGTGGVGKTRLALEASRRVAKEYPDGVIFVSLASAARPDVAFSVILRSLGGTSAEGASTSETITALIGGRCMLLVLDNFEHLLEAAGDVAALSARCPKLTVLITSRAPLRIRGENEYPVHPLSLPSSVGVATEDDITAAPAGALFVERARATSPAFTVDRESAPLVASICWRLSGIPLALELAAARTRFLSPSALLERLDEALAQSWVRDLPERQRTMNATLDWSYGLLEDPQRRLFEDLSSFYGGMSLEAIERVAVDEGLHSTFLLGSLVEQSLVEVDHSSTETRYRMLEPVRQYARARLEENIARDKVLARHAAFYLELAERYAPLLWTREQGRVLDLLDLDSANMDAAISWCLGAKDEESHEMAARFCWALWGFWWARNYHREGKRFSTATLQFELPPHLRARALPVAASSVFIYGEYEVAAGYWKEGLEIALGLNDPVAMGFNTLGQGLACLSVANFEEAGVHFEKGIEYLSREDDSLVPLAHSWFGTTLLVRGRLDEAEEAIRLGLDKARDRGDALCTYVALYNLAQVAFAREDLDLASKSLGEGIRLSIITRDQANLGHFLDAMAAVSSISGEPEITATLIGASEGAFNKVGASVYNFYIPDPTLRERAISQAKSSLGDAEFDALTSIGRGMDFDVAAEFGLSVQG